ncbi:hypothetical protein NXW08_19930 [Bacteroides uniformis]|uniref:hypothetical protein n=1 Tax=Bacteroides uniformis TaxID=820 RepID=UPI0021667006|nr:hypothetical protein [Bacteroides uniformis]MCS2725601.1 hypothetical protein [Bacteroides uniformis]
MIINEQERNVTDNKMLSVIPVAGIFFKFLLFNAIWCYYTTFTPFSCWESYATAFVATLLLSVPYILTRHIAAGVLVMSVLDIWMVANLMYYRTYFSAIPLSSYMLAGNLADFLPSVTASLRWCDWLFPVSTVVTVFLTFRIGCRQKITFRFSRWTYFVLLIFFMRPVKYQFIRPRRFHCDIQGIEIIRTSTRQWPATLHAVRHTLF